MQMRAVWALGAAVALAAGAWRWGGHVQQGEATAGGPGGASDWNRQAPTSAGNPAASAQRSPLRSAAAVHDRLYRHGSFQGTQPDGDWIVGPDGHLKPDIALRRRFEHYMLGQGEVTLDELRLLVADESRRDRGDAVSAEVLEMWDKYMRLRNYAWKYQVVIADRGTWMPAFDEQKTVRRQILGPQWAEAFYRDEEEYFVDFMARQEGRAEAPRDPGEPVIQAAPGKDAAALFEERKKAYGEAAAVRLAQADAEWADWERRLAGAKRKWAEVQADVGLTPPLRKAEMDRYVEANFKREEFLRVQSLLNLP